MAPPSRASAARLATRLTASACPPSTMRNGRTGIAAPTVNATNDPRAALTGDPIDRTSSPTSSWMRMRTAWSGSSKTASTNSGSLLLAEPALRVDPSQDRAFLVRDLAELLALERDLVVEQLALALHRDVFADAHAERARQEAGDPRQQDETGIGGGGSDAHDQGEVRHQAVVGAEHDRPQDRIDAGLVRLGRRRQQTVVDDPRRMNHSPDLHVHGAPRLAHLAHGRSGAAGRDRAACPEIVPFGLPKQPRTTRRAARAPASRRRRRRRRAPGSSGPARRTRRTATRRSRGRP